MNAFTLDAWHDFFVAQVGATAALVGLVIVAISINLATIIKEPLLSGRAGETLMLLAGVLVVSTFALVPGQPLWLFGAECVATGLCVLGGACAILAGARKYHHEQERRWTRWLLALGASLPMLAAGVSLQAGTGGGLYWLVPGVVMALVGGIANAWVLLVEVLR